MATSLTPSFVTIKVSNRSHPVACNLTGFGIGSLRQVHRSTPRQYVVCIRCSGQEEGVAAQQQAKSLLDLPLESQRPALRQKAVFNVGDTVDGKYKIVDVLGSGSSGTTYKCLSNSGDMVAMKVVALSTMKDWKQLELFKREATILQSLAHPGIPKYLDYLEVDTARDKAFVLVQELAEGKTLEDLVSSGWRVDEGEVERIALQLLDIVEYLGSRRPTVVHRDIKPANIVLGGGGAGGAVYLVDFGGVTAAAASQEDNLGSTVVGTYGYMAPEQFRGAARPQSDLYGVGATLLYMLSGRSPSVFPQDGLRIQFSDSVHTSSRMAQVVSGLMEPLLDDRLPAPVARNILLGKTTGRQTTPPVRTGGVVSRGGAPLVGDRRAAVGVVRKPAGARSSVTRRGMRLEIDVPPSGFTGGNLYTGAFAIAWNAFVLTWTLGALAGGGLLFALFSLPFWVAGAGLVKSAVGSSLFREKLTIGLRDWKLTQQLALVGKNGDRKWADIGRKEAAGSTQDLEEARVVTVAYVNGSPQTQVQIIEGVNKYIIGESLDVVEQEWIAGEINRHIQDMRQSQQSIAQVTQNLEEP